MEKVLYVSDLDGTLLGRDERLSEYTQKALNRLIEEGMLFSYATARSLTTAREVTKGLSVRIPVIVYNGAFLMESDTGKRLVSHVFSQEEAKSILAVLSDGGVFPRVYAMIDGEERFSYVEKTLSQGTKAFLIKRKGDRRARPVAENELCCGEVFCFSCIDEALRLLPLYERLKEKHQCLFYKDPYTGDDWLEVLPQEATKARALSDLQKLLGCDKTVVFGDGINDLSLFRAADEGYAVENAAEALKSIANAVIGRNDSDGVAKWLEEHFLK